MNAVWTTLQAQPATWLALTVLAWLLADGLYVRSGRRALCNPVLLGIALVMLALWLLGEPYADYFGHVRLIHFLLGPATVALAVPLYLNINRLRALALPLLLALAIGSVVGIGSALLLGRLFGLDHNLLATLAPKSVTTPIAMALSAQHGGLPALTAGIVIVTGVLCAVAAVPLLNALKLRDPLVQGFAIGIAGHGIGTARALQVSSTAGAFAGLAMGLNALVTSLLLPLLLAWMG
ncbi:LrgB family protein [Amantichitinum ursilacus]|uniref:Inner membrane protein YohK n=1 Tax=Amantichitinum ursilacus TaxID=857265 RepID=A0A0N1JT33_9NEIS|nr:LrgB family protein [Amantichitinum ursilacus]KPC53412.1 Inner membrane protein YohK [Amantichitinum ursilacus]